MIRKKFNVIKIKFESHEQIISKGLKTKCRKNQININDQVLIGESIAFLSNLFIERKIKNLYHDDQNNITSNTINLDHHTHKYKTRSRK